MRPPKEVSMRSVSVSALAGALAAWAASAFAQHHDHAHGAEGLGKVRFETSCRAEVAEEFTRAVALLHSFGYEESRRAFQDVAVKDPACGMAHWGIAMTYYHPIWAPPTPADLAAGVATAERAAQVGAKTDREDAYIAAIGAFYREAGARPHGERAQAFRKAMEDVSRRFPDDDEAAIFHALSLLGTAPASDTTFANQKRAAEILNRLLPRHPEHPGIAHYVIHSFDYPALANDALPAARAYAKIAPASAHALHMPSHIFTRLGLWQESIASNIASAAAGRRQAARTHPGTESFDALHALDYLEYAYLQIGDEAKASEVVEEAARAKRFDEPNFVTAFALTAIPARWALERRDWRTAAALERPALELPWPQFRYALAATYLAQALGAARSGQVPRAREALEALGQLQRDLAASPMAGPYDWAGHVEASRLAASAWVSRAEGRDDEPLRYARAAAELDERVGKHPVTPGAVLPPRELLGDLLLEMGRPAEALAEYEAALREAPRRFNGLAGAARAAERAGRPERAGELYGALLALAVEGSQRPELRDARRFVAAR
jgi:tetratricopeptide (TPR) repeat protein